MAGYFLTQHRRIGAVLQKVIILEAFSVEGTCVYWLLYRHHHALFR